MPHAGVWIETAIPGCIAESVWMSFPTRASRLKRQHLAGQDMGGGAGLLWVRGLKRKTRNGGARPANVASKTAVRIEAWPRSWKRPGGTRRATPGPLD